MLFFIEHGEIIIGYMMGLSTFLIRERYISIKRSFMPNKHDIQTFSKYRILFNRDLLTLFRTHDFKKSFQASKLDNFYAFFYNGLDTDSEYKFHNKKLEKHRGVLLSSMREFLDLSLIILHEHSVDGNSNITKGHSAKINSEKTRMNSKNSINASADAINKAYLKLSDACNTHFDFKISYFKDKPKNKI
jgi:hypothetical protein